jgi:hypothetical protein
MTWKEIQDGFGLDEVPANLRKEVGCCMCGAVFPGKKYSQHVAAYEHANTVRTIQTAVDKLRSDSYCRYHAEQMFGDH